MVAWAGLIFALSTMSEPPGARGGEWRSQAGHLSFYAVLGWLMVRFAVERWQAAPRVLIVACCWALAVLYGVSDEWHQSFVPGREPALLDVVFDAAGAAFGVAVLPLAARIGRSRAHG